MDETWFLLTFLATLVVITDVNSVHLTLDMLQFNEKQGKQHLAVPAIKRQNISPTQQGIYHYTVKEKRCSNLKNPNLRSALDIKLRLEERKLQTLCNYCSKSELRMKREICKRCIKTIQTRILTDSAIGKNSNTKYNPKKLERKIIEFQSAFNDTNKNEINNESSKLDKTQKKLNVNNAGVNLNSLETSSNMPITHFNLIKSASSNRQPETFETQTITGNTVRKPDSKILKLKENNSKNIKKSVGINTDAQRNGQTFPSKLTKLHPNIHEILKKKAEILNKELTDDYNTNIFDLNSSNIENDLDILGNQKNPKSADTNKLFKKNLAETNKKIELKQLKQKNAEIGNGKSSNLYKTTEFSNKLELATHKNRNILSNRNIFKNPRFKEIYEKYRQKKLLQEKLKNTTISTLPAVRNIIEITTEKNNSLNRKIIPKNPRLQKLRERYLQKKNLQEELNNSVTPTRKFEINDQTINNYEVKTENVPNYSIFEPVNNKFTNTTIQNKKIVPKNLEWRQKNLQQKLLRQKLNNIDSKKSEIIDETSNKNTLLDELLQNTNSSELKTKKIEIRSTEKNSNEQFFDEQTTENIITITKSNHPNKRIISLRNNQNMFEQNLNMKPEVDKEKYNKFRFTLKKEIPNNKRNDKNFIKSISVRNNEQIKSFLNNEHNLKNVFKENLNSDESKESVSINDDTNFNNKLQFIENKINLPLILRQNEDGTVELVLDKSQMCQQNMDNKCSLLEKSIFKRKTEDNLLKYPYDIFNILQKRNESFQHEMQTNKNIKDNFYKQLINKKLLEIFYSLNISINNSNELHSYIDDLPEKEKTELKQYLLNSISKSYETNDLKQNTKPVKTSNPTIEYRKLELPKPTESNRLYLAFRKEEPETQNHLNSGILKSLIHDQIQKELVTANVCPKCISKKCICNNLNKIFSPNDLFDENLNDESRIIDKRHNKGVSLEDLDNSSDIAPHGIVKKRYKIVNNIVDFMHDIVVHNNTNHI